jgi:hypothetical protein
VGTSPREVRPNLLRFVATALWAILAALVGR